MDPGGPPGAGVTQTKTRQDAKGEGSGTAGKSQSQRSEDDPDPPPVVSVLFHIPGVGGESSRVYVCLKSRPDTESKGVDVLPTYDPKET